MSKLSGDTMQTVTVAIADMDASRREKLERSLQGGQGIELLANVGADSSRTTPEDHALLHGDDSIDAVVSRIAQISPRILFISFDKSPEWNYALLDALQRKCPKTLVVLLTDPSAEEEQILQALASGARGYLNHETDPLYFLKAVRMVDRGEIWVTRKMLGKIMDKVVH